MNHNQRAWKTVPQHGVASCLHFCFQLLVPFERCENNWLELTHFLLWPLVVTRWQKVFWASWQTWTKSLASAGRARQAAVILTASASPFTKCWKPTSGFIFLHRIPVSVLQCWKLAFYELSSVRFLNVPHVSWTASDHQFDFHLSLISWNVKTTGMPFFFTTISRFIAFWARLWAQEVSSGIFFDTSP